MIAMLLVAVVASAWVLAVAVPSMLARPVEAALGALHRQIQRGDGFARRLVPDRWSTSLAELPLIALLAALLIAGVWAFSAIMEDVVTGDPIIGLDKRVYAHLQLLRTAPFDALLIAITGLGDQKVVMPVAVAGLVTLLALRRFRAGWYLTLAIVGGAVFVGGVKRVIARPRPVSIYDGVAEYAFPSGHAAMSVVLYGFLAVLLAYGSPRPVRRGVAFAALTLVGLIAFSRVYLGAHWLSDVLAGLAFGVAWVALLAIFYIRTAPAPVPFAPLAAVLLATVVAAGTVHALRDASAEAHRYQPVDSKGPAR
jgi:membrane-associated phospholipid phosphatase